jgi:hypothetical protein
MIGSETAVIVVTVGSFGGGVILAKNVFQPSAEAHMEG